MLIILNGFPGVGKLSIGQELIKRIDGKMIDIHSVYNLAISLTEFGSPAFFETIRPIQDIADNRVKDLPIETPVVFTEILTNDGGDWNDECWHRLLQLAKHRGPLTLVNLHCDVDENKRRIQNAGRAIKRKPRSPEFAQRIRDKQNVLLTPSETPFLSLDITKLTASEAARQIDLMIGK